MPNAPTIIKTNSTKNSVKEVNLKTVSFQELWSNYVTGDPYKVDGKVPDGFDNQCAIRMSATFHKLGIDMKSFSSKVVKPENGEKSIGRILLDGKPTATRANELRQWLNLHPIPNIYKAENITGADWQFKIKGRTGIVAFEGYWQRDSDGGSDTSGGHIDLWNKTTLTPSVESFLRFRAGINRVPNPLAFLRGREGNWYSDLGKSKQILFWEIK
ncbi:T6SS effector amidase Tae4 family protein [Collimonas pratensis]|uniref:Type VI secretion system (T6SS), amidase effector protein 4 n=1 Tax=Collimonas pratensis TaxID=279113 RepID=A0A127QA72_9BURK|nr:T6SS effector amidase Tae4 family protein [Collimonas pratensis]AMP06512.1 hypothetical protein CPter91_4197 [Collimonas pratensis]